MLPPKNSVYRIYSGSGQRGRGVCFDGGAVFLREAAASHRSVVLPSVLPVLSSSQPPPPGALRARLVEGFAVCVFQGASVLGIQRLSGTLRCRTLWNTLQGHCMGAFCARDGAGRPAASSVCWCFPGADLPLGGGGWARILHFWGDESVGHHLTTITRAVLGCPGLGWVQGDCLPCERGGFPGAEFGDFSRGCSGGRGCPWIVMGVLPTT
jgi:hypothetical protein